MEAKLSIVHAIVRAIVHAKEISVKQQCYYPQRIGHFVTSLRRELPLVFDKKLQNRLIDTFTWSDIGIVTHRHINKKYEIQELVIMAELATHKDKEKNICKALGDLDGQIKDFLVQQKYADLLYDKAEDLVEELTKTVQNF